VGGGGRVRILGEGKEKEGKTCICIYIDIEEI
jgi:hypothetical protein